MTLIDDITVNGYNFKFFDGIDFNLIKNHPKDGSAGFYIFFIEDWMKEVTIYNRDSKIESVLNNSIYIKFNHLYIDNNFISLYQTSGVNVLNIYKVVRDSIINRIFGEEPWIPVTGITTGDFSVKSKLK